MGRVVVLILLMRMLMLENWEMMLLHFDVFVSHGTWNQDCRYLRKRMDVNSIILTRRLRRR